MSWPLDKYLLTPFACRCSTIVDRVPALIARAGITDVALIPTEVQPIDLPNGLSLLRVGFSFKTTDPAAKCHAAFKFVQLASGKIKLFTTTTSLQELDAKPWRDCVRKEKVSSELPAETEALIVGAGWVVLPVEDLSVQS